MFKSQHFRISLWFGLLTLPTVLVANAEASTIKQRVSVQPIQVCDDSGLSCATTKFLEDETDKIWTQANIDINFLSLRKLNNSKLKTIDNTSELFSLFTGSNNQQNSNLLVLNMWFVDKLLLSKGTTFGVTQAIGARNIAIAKDAFTFNGQGRLDTLAHEIGHSLGLDHNDFGAGGNLNLMTTGSARLVPSSINDIFPNGAKIDRLTANQITQAKSSKFALSISAATGTQSSRFNVLDDEPAAEEESVINVSSPNELESEHIHEASVPEPSAILGSIGMGLFGLYTQLKSKRKLRL